MVRNVLASVLCAAVWATSVASPRPAAAEPVVVELFTSQGCSSCPPADALLADLARRDDVVALALHVDYWDYIGWKDTFASPAFTKRQRAYAKAAGRTMVYTPQMIVAGRIDIAGTHPARVFDAIAAAAAEAPAARVAVTREAGRLRIALDAAETFDAPAQIVLVRFHPATRVEVTRGENAGRTTSHVNVVAEWHVLAKWTGAAPLAIEAEYPADATGAVLVQEDGPGAVLAAARVD